MLPRACMGIVALRQEFCLRVEVSGFRVLGGVGAERPEGFPVEGCEVSMWEMVMFGLSIFIFKFETRAVFEDPGSRNRCTALRAPNHKH